ncbi:MAG: BCCT family transporter [Bdellovibrionota bacterium]
MKKSVFLPSSVLIFFITFLTARSSKEAEGVFSSMQNWINSHFGWLYFISMTIFLVFMLSLCISPYGKLKLGENHEEPEFSTLSWFAMLFSAGMGIGLLFYSVAEPIMHLTLPAPFLTSFPVESRPRYSMALTFYHWGLHPWACYALVGLSLAFFSFRKKMPFTLRSVFYPLLGEKIHGIWGDIIDVIAIVSTLFGVATSLGIGASQINAGLSYLFHLHQGNLEKIMIISIITLFATISVITGLKKGIKFLSQANMFLALGMMLCLLALGPTLYLMYSWIDNIVAYVSEFAYLSSTLYSFDETSQVWQNGWTILYWAWWISWSPFVGMFIARISRGRTIREFILGVTIVPSLLSFLWFTVFGSSALKMEMDSPQLLSKVVNQSVVEALFVFLEQYPYSTFFIFAGTISIVLFFVTSSDSASLVIDTIASGGKKNPHTLQKIYWATLEGAVAAILLTYGGLRSLQKATLTVALPFCILLIFLMFGLYRSLQNEYSIYKRDS